MTEGKGGSCCHQPLELAIWDAPPGWFGAFDESSAILSGCGFSFAVCVSQLASDAIKAMNPLYKEDSTQRKVPGVDAFASPRGDCCDHSVAASDGAEGTDGTPLWTPLRTTCPQLLHLVSTFSLLKKSVEQISLAKHRPLKNLVKSLNFSAF